MMKKKMMIFFFYWRWWRWWCWWRSWWWRWWWWWWWWYGNGWRKRKNADDDEEKDDDGYDDEEENDDDDDDGGCLYWRCQIMLAVFFWKTLCRSFREISVSCPPGVLAVSQLCFGGLWRLGGTLGGVSVSLDGVRWCFGFCSCFRGVFWYLGGVPVVFGGIEATAFLEPKWLTCQY